MNFKCQNDLQMLKQITDIKMIFSFCTKLQLQKQVFMLFIYTIVLKEQKCLDS